VTEDNPLVVRRVGPPILISRAEYDELVFDGWDGVARVFWDELGARAAALYSHALVPLPLAGPRHESRHLVEDEPHRCPAHGDVACTWCAQNPASCGPDSNNSPACDYYRETGMHWDTCPNRVLSAPPT